jgi:predicted GNAT family N-acyltransferase
MIDRRRNVMAYYTLSAYAIRASELPPEMARKLQKYPLLPATLLGRFAVSQAHQGQKLGRLLLMDALFRSWKNTAEVASVGVVAEAYNEAVRDFYLHHEFMPLMEHPRKLFIAMGTIQKALS